MGVIVNSKTSRTADMSILWFSMDYNINGFNSAIVSVKNGGTYTQVNGLSISGTSSSVSISGLSPNTTYKVNVTLDALYRPTQTLTTVSDSSSDFTTDPLMPTLTLIDATPVSVKLSWDPYEPARFTLERSVVANFSNPVFIGNPLTPETERIDSNVVPGTSYYYKVTAVSDLDNYTATSNILTVITPTPAVCFLGDAPVLTARGYRPIREFRVGDMVMTADGREVAVSRVFSRLYGPSAAVNPYVIPKGFLGATRPVAISPNHEVLVPGRGMVKARDLGLRRMKMAGDFTYYNLELEDWVRDNLVVAGVTVESLAPAARITMTKPEFARFVTARYGPVAAARLRTVCFEEGNNCISLPAL